MAEAPPLQTRLLATDTPKAFDTAVAEAVRLVQAGDVVALPTETVYGLAANALNPEAVAKIFAVKERPSFDPLIVHVLDRAQAATVADIPAEIQPIFEALTKEFWPGPLTILLPKSSRVPDLVTSGLPMVALRSPAHPVFRRVIKGAGCPLAAPSANRFGRISPTSSSAVMKELGGRIQAIIDGGACSEGLESTIVRIIPQPGRPKPMLEVLRPGPITKDALQKIGQVRYLKREAEAASPAVPGQLASHYAPVTPLRIVDDPESFQPEPGKRYALLSLAGEEDEDSYVDLTDWHHIGVLSPGSGKLHEASIRFFAVLRQLDECGADEIIAEPLAEQGLGLALMDRLRRAAAK